VLLTRSGHSGGYTRDLSIHDLHSGLWVTPPCRSTRPINLGEILRGQPNLQGADIILKVVAQLGAGNGNDVIPLESAPPYYVGWVYTAQFGLEDRSITCHLLTAFRRHTGVWALPV